MYETWTVNQYLKAHYSTFRGCSALQLHDYFRARLPFDSSPVYLNLILNGLDKVNWSELEELVSE